MDSATHLALCDVETHGQCASPGMDFNFNPSLASRAAIKVTVTLWYHEDILNPQRINLLLRNDMKHEDKVAENALSLLIPHNLKEDIVAYICDIKNQLKHWMRVFGKRILYDVHLYNDFCWTSTGLIDSTKTVSNIIRRGYLAHVNAFELACISCTAEHIYELWPLIKNDYDTNKYFLQREIAFWVWHLRDMSQTPNTNNTEQSELFEEGFISAFYDVNLSALKFFFEQQQLEDRKSYISTTEDTVRFAHFDSKPLIVLFLLGYMDSRHQDQFLKSDPVNNLICFIEWPLQHFFLQVADKLWESLTEQDFLEVIIVLTAKIRAYKHEAVLYRNLFIGFWMKSPLKLRNHYIKSVFGEIFRDIFYPLPKKTDLNIPHSSAYDESILYTTFGNDARASLYCILEEDKPSALRALFKKFP